MFALMGYELLTLQDSQSLNGAGDSEINLRLWMPMQTTPRHGVARRGFQHAKSKISARASS